MRGGLDFEAWEWENPLCAAFVWGPPGARKRIYLTDHPPYRRPDALANAALVMLRKLRVEEGIGEWWAHNMGRYDGLILVDAAEKVGWKVSAVIANGRPITFNITPPDSKSIKLCDTFALAPAGLATLAEEWQLSSRKHLKKSDYKIDPRLWDPELRQIGCEIDAQLTLELAEKVESLAAEWGVPKLRATFSSIALATIRADLATRGMKLPSHAENFQYLDFGRSGYLGGRVEIFHHHPEPWLCEHDISSSYPASMCLTIPWELEGETQTKRGVERIFSGDREGLLYATVKVPESMHIPPLPYRPDSGGVFFPVGKWSAVFAACELRYAASLGVQVEPHHGVAYTAAAPFREFVERAYALKASAKAEGKTAVANFCKLVLNGGYGKFGMGPELETLHIATSIAAAHAMILRSRPGTVKRLSPVHRRFLSRKRVQWPEQTHYGIASYITAYSRISVHRALVAAKNPAYCDTDSVHAEALGPEVAIGKGLGQWEPKLKRFRGEYFAPKLYRLTDPSGELHFASKGFPLPKKEDEEELAEWIADQKNARERAERFEAVVSGKDIPIASIAGLKAQLAKYGGRFTRQGGKRAPAIIRHWLGHSTKRRPLDDGSTVPWRVDQLKAGEHQTAVSPLFSREERARGSR